MQREHTIVEKFAFLRIKFNVIVFIDYSCMCFWQFSRALFSLAGDLKGRCTRIGKMPAKTSWEEDKGKSQFSH